MKHEKRKYMKPEIEDVFFDSGDIIATSGGTIGGDTDLPEEEDDNKKPIELPIVPLF